MRGQQRRLNKVDGRQQISFGCHANQREGVRHDFGWNPKGGSSKSVEVAAAFGRAAGIGRQARCARYKHDAQASEFSGTLACASCLSGDKHSSAVRLTPSELTTTHSFNFTQNGDAHPQRDCPHRALVRRGMTQESVQPAESTSRTIAPRVAQAAPPRIDSPAADPAGSAGRLAQLVRAPCLHRGCRGFESLIAQ